MISGIVVVVIRVYFYLWFLSYLLMRYYQLRRIKLELSVFILNQGIKQG